jgi:hypothetical protein
LVSRFSVPHLGQNMTNLQDYSISPIWPFSDLNRQAMIGKSLYAGDEAHVQNSRVRPLRTGWTPVGKKTHTESITQVNGYLRRCNRSPRRQPRKSSLVSDEKALERRKVTASHQRLFFVSLLFGLSHSRRARTCRPKVTAQRYFHGHHHLALRASSNLMKNG